MLLEIEYKRILARVRHCDCLQFTEKSTKISSFPFCFRVNSFYLIFFLLFFSLSFYFAVTVYFSVKNRIGSFGLSITFSLIVAM